MTAEEMEVTYCKARVTCMKSFRLLIREHLKLSEEALNLKLSYEKVHKLIMAGLQKVDDELSDELNKWLKLLSEREKSVNAVEVDANIANAALTENKE